MRHPLDGVNAKLGRAKEHLDDLEADIARRLQAKDYGIRGHLDPKTGEHIVYAWAPYKLRMEWGLRAGDVVHNIRSALDHLIYQLVLANGETPRTQNEFPIYSCLAQYRNENGVRKLVGVRKGAVTIIEGLQPTTTGDPLWVLRCLDIEDKHHLVNVAVVGADLGSVGIGGSGFIREISIATTEAILDGLEDGADLYRRLADPDVKVQTSPKVEVTFAVSGPGGGKPVVPLLAGLLDYVKTKVIPLFGLAKRKPRVPRWKPPG